MPAVSYFAMIAQVVPVLFLAALLELRQLARESHRRRWVVVALAIVLAFFSLAAEWVSLSASVVLESRKTEPEQWLPAANLCFAAVMATMLLISVMAIFQSAFAVEHRRSNPAAKAISLLEADSQRISHSGDHPLIKAFFAAALITAAIRRPR